jgi:hypothetical protein
VEPRRALRSTYRIAEILVGRDGRNRRQGHVEAVVCAPVKCSVAAIVGQRRLGAGLQRRKGCSLVTDLGRE